MGERGRGTRGERRANDCARERTSCTRASAHSAERTRERSKSSAGLGSHAGVHDRWRVRVRRVLFPRRGHRRPISRISPPVSGVSSRFPFEGSFSAHLFLQTRDPLGSSSFFLPLSDNISHTFSHTRLRRDVTFPNLRYGSRRGTRDCTGTGEIFSTVGGFRTRAEICRRDVTRTYPTTRQSSSSRDMYAHTRGET